MLILNDELIFLFIIVLSSIFIALVIIMFSLSVIVSKSSKLNDKNILDELIY